jgi:hypothetical protein
MAKEKTVSTLTVPTIKKIAGALAASLTSARNSGDALNTFCDTAARAGFSAEPSEQDVIAIVDTLSSELGWKGTPREKQNKSEARKIVRWHSAIPELQTALRASEHGVCSYHDTVKLCRLMPKAKTVKAAVAAFNSKTAAKKKASAHDVFARALRAYYQAVSESRRGDKSARLAALRKVGAALDMEVIAE